MEKNAEEFERLLRLPHAFIFHREYFEHGEGRAQREEYESLRRGLSDFQEKEFRASAGQSVTTRMGWVRDTSGSWRMTKMSTGKSDN